MLAVIDGLAGGYLGYVHVHEKDYWDTPFLENAKIFSMFSFFAYSIQIASPIAPELPKIAIFIGFI